MQEAIIKAAHNLAKQLQEKKRVLVTAESCTGGGVGKALTSVAGASGWYAGGFITYSNAMKIKLLNVDSTAIDAKGAVSEDVVKQMLLGAISASSSDVAIAVSGIAGPGGGTPLKPVGTVCVAWGSSANVCAATLSLKGAREEIRDTAILFAIDSVSLWLDPL